MKYEKLKRELRAQRDVLRDIYFAHKKIMDRHVYNSYCALNDAIDDVLEQIWESEQEDE